MPGATPVWNLPYPCAGETIDPDIFCEFSNAVDSAMETINDNAEFAANRPNARIDRTLSLPTTFAAGVATPVTFDTEVFDNNNMANLGISNGVLTIQTPGLYWVSFSVGGFTVFTTWTRYLMSITQNGLARTNRKFMINVAQSIPANNTITGVVLCAAGDLIRGQFTFIGTGGPMQISRGSLSASFICDGL